MMELIGSYRWMNCTVEAYFPEPGKDDVWTLWVVEDGRVVHEVALRRDVTSPYGIDHSALAMLERAAEQAIHAVIRKTRSPQGGSWDCPVVT